MATNTQQRSRATQTARQRQQQQSRPQSRPQPQPQPRPSSPSQALTGFENPFDDISQLERVNSFQQQQLGGLYNNIQEANFNRDRQAAQLQWQQEDKTRAGDYAFQQRFSAQQHQQELGKMRDQNEYSRGSQLAGFQGQLDLMGAEQKGKDVDRNIAIWDTMRGERLQRDLAKQGANATRQAAALSAGGSGGGSGNGGLSAYDLKDQAQKDRDQQRNLLDMQLGAQNRKGDQDFALGMAGLSSNERIAAGQVGLGKYNTFMGMSKGQDSYYWR